MKQTKTREYKVFAKVVLARAQDFYLPIKVDKTLIVWRSMTSVSRDFHRIYCVWQERMKAIRKLSFEKL